MSEAFADADVPPATVDFSADRLGGRSDDVYAALLAAHAGLSADESAALDARLILLLLNLVGDADTAIAAIRHVRRD
jgi:hypothetical protein